MAYAIHIVNMVLIYGILGLSLNLLIGYSGLMTMAAAAMFGIGSYTFGIFAVHLGLPLWLCGISAIVVTTLLSGVSAWPALRVKGEYLILLTLALQMLVHDVLNAARTVTGGASGLPGIPRPEFWGHELLGPASYLPFIFIITAISFAFAFWLGYSPFGRVLRALRDNESAAAAIGKNVNLAKFSVFTASGALSGLAGVAFASYQAFVSPESFSLHESIIITAIVVVGGAGNLQGTILGSLIVIAVPETLRFVNLSADLTGPIRSFLFGALLIVFMMYRPQGLIPEHRQRRSSRESKRHPEAESSPHLETGGKRPARLGSPQQIGTRVSRSFAQQGLESEELAPVDNGATEGDLLRVENLTKSFGGIRPANGLTFSLPRGRVTALVGPNGAGKTTLFNLITGYLTPDEGKVFFRGRDITFSAIHSRVKLGIARSWQDVRLFGGMTVLDNVLCAIPGQSDESLISMASRPLWMYSQKAFVDRALSVLDIVGLKDRAQDAVTSLPLGERKLVSLARLIATEAEILLLDEPTSGVDIQWVNQIMSKIRDLQAQGKTICIVEHNLEVVRTVADHAYFLNMGFMIAEGTPEELMSSQELADTYFGKGKR